MKNSLDSENNIIITEFPHPCKVLPSKQKIGVDFNKIVYIYNQTFYIYGRWNVHIYNKIFTHSLPNHLQNSFELQKESFSNHH